MEPRSPAERIAGAVAVAADSLVGPGDWLDGAQRRRAWVEARDARTNELDNARRQAISPNAVAGGHEGNDELAAAAMEVVHRVASDPGRLSRSWADSMIEVLGDAVYTELVGITATAAALDMFAWATSGADLEIGAAVAGKAAQVRPDDVGDIGAWVPQTIGGVRANVSRSLSLVPATNIAWIGLVDALYSRGADFVDLSWTRALSRPQVELVAARTTAELECFY